MVIVKNGGSFNRTKHMINNKHLFIKQHIELKSISLEYCPSARMAADILSKPLEGYQLRKVLNLIWLVTLLELIFSILGQYKILFYSFILVS